MPVPATPIIIPPSPSVCTDQNVIIPVISQQYDNPIITKLRGVAVQQGQLATLQLPMLDRDGRSVNLATCQGVGATAKSFFQEAIALAPGGISGDSVILDVDNGVVGVEVPDQVRLNPGVYICETGLTDDSNNLIFSNRIYVFVERGLFMPTGSGPLQDNGPPSLMEFRIRLRDNPEINRLIDEYEFDIADICDAIVRSVMEWNMTPPPIPDQYDTTSFPWRYQLSDGVAAHLFESAAHYYRRNAWKHQGTGIAEDDLNREKEYLQASEMRRQRWTTWVKMNKASINMNEGFSTYGSDYAYGRTAWGGW